VSLHYCQNWGSTNVFQADTVFTLRHFPRGYRLFTHHKSDGKEQRTDNYLYGSTHVKVFRSPAEFAFHLKWLLSGRPVMHVGGRSRPICKCKYCDPSAKQSELSRVWFNYTLRARETDKEEKESLKKGTKRPVSFQQRDYGGVGGAIWRE